MRNTILVTSLAAGVYASQGFIQKDGSCENPCLTYDAAHQIATNFGQLISAYTPDLAQRALTPDFTDSSDSVNTLINYGCTAPKPLGSTTFTDRSAFMAAQSSQPAVPWELLNLWYACQGPVVMRWRSAQTPQAIVGNIVVEVQRNLGGQEPWLMKTLFSEFNSGAWLVNQGTIKSTNCSVGAAAPAAQAASPAPSGAPSGAAAAGGSAAPPTTEAPAASAGAGTAPSGPLRTAAGPPAGAADGAGAATGPPSGSAASAGPAPSGPPTGAAGPSNAAAGGASASPAQGPPPTFGVASGSESIFGRPPTAAGSV